MTDTSNTPSRHRTVAVWLVLLAAAGMQGVDALPA